MSEIKLFRLSGTKATEIPGTAGGLEKSLQSIIEKNLDTMLGVRFLDTEYFTGKTHGGRVDTLGLDENGCPVIIEYKRAVSENVVSQGLFYLDWLLDHKAEFQLLVSRELGKKAADEIAWDDPRLVCIASDFTRYDEHAVRQMDRNIDLVRYRRFGSDLLALELVNRSSEDAKGSGIAKSSSKAAKGSQDRLLRQAITDAVPLVRDLFELLRDYLFALGGDVQEKRLKRYVAFRRIKNFASVVILKNELQVFLKVDPESVNLEDGFSRDMRNVGHWGTGDLRLTIKTKTDLQRAESLVLRSYEEA